ncbi:MAG: alkaline phosphatase, partial [Phycisphaerae bacterium]
MKSTKMLAILFLVLGLTIGLVSTAQAEPKYVIFFIGDGMGFEQVKAAGMYAHGEPGTLSFESFPYHGELTTYSADSTVPDSAAAGTALATGVKVNYGVISMAYPGDGSELETLLEYFKARGKSTGLVTTSLWFDATPAAFGAHESSRYNYGGIINDYLYQTRPNVVLGGYHDDDMATASESAGYTIVTDRAAMQALDTETETMVFGQFGTDYLPYEYDGLGSLPHLSEMATTSLSILDNDPDGFFLMVEGGRIDQACHSNDTPRAVLETVEFDNTLQVTIDWAAGRTDTLILVTADHETGGLTVLANNGAGVFPTVDWGSTDHTAANVPVYAWGVNAEMISGVMDNTDMFRVVTGDPQAWNPDPADGAVHPETSATLSWIRGAGAVSHDVYFGESFNDVNDGIGGTFQGNQTETSFTVGLAEFPYSDGLVPDTTYYWRIDEVNDLDPNSPCKGDVWSFMTGPGYATQPDPANNAVGVAIDATLSWLPGLTAATRDVYFGTSSPPPFIRNQAESSYDPGPLEVGTTYYWRIDEIEADGTTIYTGDIWIFTIAPGYATQPDPANDGFVVVLDTTLSWLPGPTAATHDVYFGTSSPPPFIGNQTAASFDPGPLEFGTTYYWQIDEVEADGTTVYTGDIWSFTIAPGYATQPDPANDGFVVVLDTTLSWLPGPTAATHDVY